MGNNGDAVDVLVIGAGASGGAFTWSLSEAGIKVMCLEQGDWLDPKAYPTTQDDWELHRYTDFNADPNVRGLPVDYPVNNTDSPIAPLMYNAVGGSAIHWSAHFPRLHPSEFRVRGLDGVAAVAMTTPLAVFAAPAQAVPPTLRLSRPARLAPIPHHLLDLPPPTLL